MPRIPHEYEHLVTLSLVIFFVLLGLSFLFQHHWRKRRWNQVMEDAKHRITVNASYESIMAGAPTIFYPIVGYGALSFAVCISVIAIFFPNLGVRP